MTTYFLMGQSRPFLFIFFLLKHILQEKTVDFSGTHTQIVGVEGDHADHLTTTTAPSPRVNTQES